MRWQHCWASAWFFWTSTWFTSLSRDWRVGTTTHHRYHWLTDDTVVRVHWPALRYWNRARIFIKFFNISSLTAHISKILNANNEFSCLCRNIYLSEVNTFSYLAFWYITRSYERSCWELEQNKNKFLFWPLHSHIFWTAHGYLLHYLIFPHSLHIFKDFGT